MYYPASPIKPSNSAKNWKQNVWDSLVLTHISRHAFLMALPFVWTAENDAKMLLCQWMRTFRCVSVYAKKKHGPTNLCSYIISIGNSMICSDIWHKYHEWYFKIVIRNETILKYHELSWNSTALSQSNCSNFSCSSTMRGILILQINSTIWRHTNVNNVIVSVKLFLDVGNGKYIILCNFGGHFLSGFEVMIW